jgi:hypothetical protein
MSRAKGDTSSTPKSTFAPFPTTESPPASTLPEAPVPVVGRRGRSNTISGDRPWETPLTAEDQRLGALVSRLTIQIPQRDPARPAVIESPVNTKDLVANSSAVEGDPGRKTQTQEIICFLPARHPTPPTNSPPSPLDSTAGSETGEDTPTQESYLRSLRDQRNFSGSS